MKYESWVPYFPKIFAFQSLSVLVKSFFKKVLILDYWVDFFDFATVTDADGILRFLFGVFFLGHIIKGA